MNSGKQNRIHESSFLLDFNYADFHTGFKLESLAYKTHWKMEQFSIMVIWSPLKAPLHTGTHRWERKGGLHEIKMEKGESKTGDTKGRVFGVNE